MILQATMTLMLTTLAIAGFVQTAHAQGRPAASVTLQTAVAESLVDAVVTGTGASSGDSVFLRIRKTPRSGATPLVVTVPGGTILRSSSAADQSMVVSGVRGVDLGGGMMRAASAAVLEGDGWVTVVLFAFCIEFSKDNPSSMTMFDVEEPNPTLACITTNARGLSVEAQQAAVWIFSDRMTFFRMGEKFDVGGAEWREAAQVAQQCGVIPR